MTPTLTSARMKAAPLSIPEKELRNSFNHAAFLFNHTLADNPAFTLSNLSSVMERRQKMDSVFWNAGDKRVGQAANEDVGRDFSLKEAMEHIEKTKSWITILDAHCEPEIREVLDNVILQVEDELGWPLSRAIKTRNVHIFVTSPHRITSFHIDRECTFLVQIHGSKKIHVFSAQDRDMLKEEELERFWAGDNHAHHYRSEFENHASVFTLTPGTGVHIPVNAGHWLENGPEVSISVGIHFQFHNHRLANIYRANHILRKVGISPIPPGRNELRDKIKGWGMEPAIMAAKLIDRTKSRKHY